MNKNIFLYGVPGSGKTTLAHLLQKELKYNYLELDDVREHLTNNELKSDLFLSEYTTTAWKKFGDLNEENAIKGLIAVRNSIQPFVFKEIEKHKEAIIAEAAFLDPKIRRDCDDYFLVICQDKEKHYDQFFVHREKSPDSDLQFKVGHYIEKYLINEAEELRVKIVYNEELEKTIAAILSLIG